ncbi:hypothetical protein GmHk_11G032074 [Glycine max]|nr:hypothetical protein GmHk_11G032074 [Glycine max]
MDKNNCLFFKCWIESAHWALKRLLHNSLEDLCSVWEAMNNRITLQHTEIKASFEANTHMVRHFLKVTLYKRLIGMISRYVLRSIPLDTIHMFWRRLSFLNQGLSEPKVSITEEMKTISKWFEELDACAKVALKSKLREMPTLI